MPKSVEKTVFDAKPIFKEIITQQGATPIGSYLRQKRYTGSAIPVSRRTEYARIVKRLLTRPLGAAAAQSAALQLKKRPIASTAAHHDTATHPFFAHTILAEALASPRSTHRNIIALSCGGISMNNSSFPRGLLFHDERGAEGRLLFTSLKHHLHPVHEHQPYTLEAMRAAVHSVEHLALSRERKQSLHRSINLSFGSKSTLSLPTYSEQLTRGIFTFWKQIPEVAKHHVIYLEQETLTRELLIAYHLTQKTIIHAILFDEKTRTTYLHSFDGIQGAFDRKAQRGTELFWGLSKDNRIPLRVINNELVNPDYTLRIPLTPKDLSDALSRHLLMPSMALTFSVLSFYYGIACGGGFSQVNYLTDMKKAYCSFLRAVQAPTLEETIASLVPTNIFTGEIVVAHLNAGGQTQPATAIDLVLYRTAKTRAMLTETIRTQTLRSVINPMLPELYKIITGTRPAIQKTTKMPSALSA